MKRKVVAIVLARINSTRLPGKVLMDICGRPMLGHIIDRLKKVRLIDEIILATTSQKEDEVLLDFAKEEEIKSFAYEGDPEDVVARIREAGEKFKADIMVNVNGDCPLIHPPVIEQLIKALVEHDAEMSTVANLDGKKVIHGGVNVFTLKGWQKVDENSTELYQRQNTTACLLDYPDLLKKVEVKDKPIFYQINHRIWVDTPADLEFMREVYKRLYKPGKIVNLEDVIHLLEKHPDLMEINSHVRQKGLKDKSRKVVFRVDGDEKVGMGHIVRCLALATELQERYFCGVSFIIKGEGGIAEMIREKGFKVEVLPSRMSGEDEAKRIVDFSRDYGANRIILDLKDEVSPEYIFKLRKTNIPVISMDNNGEGAFFADVNIFPVAHFIPDNRWKKYRGKLYYGPEYVILRREFRKDYPPLDNKTPNILITMGGSDRENLTRKILQATLSIPDVRITVILGRFFTYYSEIRQMAARKGNIDVYRDVQNIAEFMLRADLAITYFGVTAYELAKMGVPAIVIAHSERDKINAERFSKYGTCISLGYFKEVNEKKIYSATRRLLGDKKLREKMSENGKKLLDGKGGERVARIIVDSVRGSGVSIFRRNKNFPINEFSCQWEIVT